MYSQIGIDAGELFRINIICVNSDQVGIMINLWTVLLLIMFSSTWIRIRGTWSTVFISFSYACTTRQLNIVFTISICVFIVSSINIVTLWAVPAFLSYYCLLTRKKKTGYFLWDDGCLVRTGLDYKLCCSLVVLRGHRVWKSHCLLSICQFSRYLKNKEII